MSAEWLATQLEKAKVNPDLLQPKRETAPLVAQATESQEQTPGELLKQMQESLTALQEGQSPENAIEATETISSYIKFQKQIRDAQKMLNTYITTPHLPKEELDSAEEGINIYSKLSQTIEGKKLEFCSGNKGLLNSSELSTRDTLSNIASCVPGLIYEGVTKYNPEQKVLPSGDVLPNHP